MVVSVFLLLHYNYALVVDADLANNYKFCGSIIECIMSEKNSRNPRLFKFIRIVNFDTTTSELYSAWQTQISKSHISLMVIMQLFM